MRKKTVKKIRITSVLIIILLLLVLAVIDFYPLFIKKSEPVVTAPTCASMRDGLEQKINHDVFSSDTWVLYCENGNSLEYIDGENINDQEGIASITKLMTALVTSETYPTNTIFTVPASAIGPATYGRFIVEQKFTESNIFYSLFLESDNDAARTLADALGRPQFVSLMNQKAVDLGLDQTHYTDPSGIDLGDGQGAVISNFSTPSNIAHLIYYIYKNTKLLDYTRFISHPVYSLSGFSHTATSTDKFLITPAYAKYIIAAKTGNTPLADNNLALIFQYNGHTFVSVVLDSDNSFGDSENFLNAVIY